MSKGTERGAPEGAPSGAHQATIVDQFSRQAEGFAKSPGLHGEAVLELLVQAVSPRTEDTVLDVACGPGTVVAAFAPHVRKVTGLDATEAMLDQARTLASKRGLTNVEWQMGDAYALPFADGSFDIVNCRFTFHHLQEPGCAFAEMVRVCRPGGRVVLCDGVASDDPAKAAAFNSMERYRDPSTVEFRTLGFLLSLFEEAGLPPPAMHRFEVPTERDSLVARSFPVNGDRDGLRRMITQATDTDAMGVNARREKDTVVFGYQSVVLVASKPA
jgi:ubiquinone/menaquinone biosynthesis C-methylase UbiE